MPRSFSWIAAAASAAVLAVGLVSRSFPDLPAAITLQVRFPAGVPGTSEPLLATGSFRQGDFLTVRYLDEQTAVLAYGAWGIGGPSSGEFPLRPGMWRELKVTMPGFGRATPAAPGETGLLRVMLDGRELLRGAVAFHAHEPAEVFFGGNLVGGNTAGLRFRGELATARGRPLRGGPGSYFSWRERLGHWLAHPAQIVAVLFAGAVAGFGARPLRARLSGWRAAALAPRPLSGHPLRPHGWFAATALACSLAFAWLVSCGTFQLRHAESFGSFYDHQAASLLQGRLDVPEAALSGEAFFIDGKFYGYFGIVPALLRVPFVLAGVGFGELSRLSLLACHFACLAAAYAWLCLAVRIVCGAGAWPSRTAVVIFVGTVGLGTTLFFLGSRAFIYHEAILCGVAFALWSAYWSLRHFCAPSRASWIAGLLLGVAALHARPTAGLFALAVLGCIAAARAIAAWRSGRPARGPVLIGVAALAGLATFPAMSYAKFGTLDGGPLRYHVQYTPERLARFAGGNFHVANLRHNLDAYLLEPDLRVERRFPWLYLGGPGRVYLDTRIDHAELTLGIPFAMPAMFALALAGGIWAALKAPAWRVPFAVLTLGALPAALALGTAIAISHRYTGDFCPFLIAGAAGGLAALDGERGWRRRAALAGTALLGIASCLITLALAIHFQRETVWGVPEEPRANYRLLRQQVDAFFGVPAPGPDELND